MPSSQTFSQTFDPFVLSLRKYPELQLVQEAASPEQARQLLTSQTLHPLPDDMYPSSHLEQVLVLSSSSLQISMPGMTPFR